MLVVDRDRFAADFLKEIRDHVVPAIRIRLEEAADLAELGPDQRRQLETACMVFGSTLATLERDIRAGEQNALDLLLDCAPTSDTHALRNYVQRLALPFNVDRTQLAGIAYGIQVWIDEMAGWPPH